MEDRAKGRFCVRWTPGLLVWEQGVGGSNPSAPTNDIKALDEFGGTRVGGNGYLSLLWSRPGSEPDVREEPLILSTFLLFQSKPHTAICFPRRYGQHRFPPSRPRHENQACQHKQRQ